MLTRRDFLKFVVGGAVGTLFSPLPWRMADEMVLFSQTWTYQPPKGKEKWVYTLCQLCPGGCGLKVRKIDDRVVKIEGNQLNPVNRGGLCPLGASSVQLLYGEHRRVKKPLKRVGERGEGKWEEIEWSTALNILTQKLQELRINGHGYTVACLDGYRNELVSGLIRRFCQAYGTPNYLTMPSGDETTSLVINALQGHEGHVGFDLENSDYILSFGSGLLEGWGAPVRMQIAYRYIYENPFKPKAKIIQIESRMSDTATRVDEWVGINPGTETALALGIAHVLIKQGIYNQEFINNYTAGFDSFKKLVLEQYKLERVSKITGVSKEDIIRIAKEFGQAKRPIAIWGRGKGDIPCGLYEIMAIHSLNALIGNINRKGGVICFNDPSETWWPEFGLDEIAKKTLSEPRIDTSKFPLITSLLYRFAENVNSQAHYKINALLIFEANPCYAAPDPALFIQALKNIPFVVTFTSFLDETAKYADLVLPAAFFLEKWEGITTPRGLQYPIFGVSKPVLKSPYDVKHPADVILTLAKNIKGIAQAMPWRNYKEVLKAAVKKLYQKGEGKLADKEYLVSLNLDGSSLPGSFEAMWEILNKCIWFNPNVKKEGFKTASGKFEFSPKELNLSHYEEWELKGEKEEFPLMLIPSERLMLTDGYLGNAPYMVKALPNTVLIKNDLVVEINPATAAKYHLIEGDKVLLKTPFGEAKVRVHISELVLQDVIAIPIGLGHNAYDEYLEGKGINAHQLLGYAKEKLTGIATWALSRANLIKI